MISTIVIKGCRCTFIETCSSLFLFACVPLLQNILHSRKIQNPDINHEQYNGQQQQSIHWTTPMRGESHPGSLLRPTHTHTLTLLLQEKVKLFWLDRLPPQVPQSTLLLSTTQRVENWYHDKAIREIGNSAEVKHRRVAHGRVFFFSSKKVIIWYKSLFYFFKRMSWLWTKTENWTVPFTASASSLLV